MRSKTTPSRARPSRRSPQAVLTIRRPPAASGTSGMGTTWQSSHPVVIAHPEWFVELGQGQTAPAYMPGRAA